MTERLPDGVHLGLESQPYFDQDAIGSSDLVALHQRKHGWWWTSRHNPAYVRKERKDLMFGTALHAIVLEGLGAYEERFICEPVRPQGCIDSIAEMRAKLEEHRFALRGTSAWRREDWLRAMRQNLPRVPVWENILADFGRVAAGRTILPAATDAALRMMHGIVTDPERDDNADLRTLFGGAGDFPALAEVSILHTLPDGQRLRWRIDRMFPRFDLDLKSLGNWSGRPLEWETGDEIARRAMDIQRDFYFDGRTIAYRYIAEGKIFGGTPEQRRWIKRFPTEFPMWDWVWLFYQKPDSVHGRAPVIFPIWDDSFEEMEDGTLAPSPLRLYGGRKAAKAMAFYRESVARYGLDQPWAEVAPMHFTDPDIAASKGRRPIYLPSWIADDEPVQQAAYAEEESPGDV